MSDIPAGFRFGPATFDDWRTLSALHYRSSHVGAYACAFGLWRGSVPLALESAVAVVVFAYPPLSSAGRNLALNNAFNRQRCSIRPFGNHLNAHIRTLKRTVVATPYRGRGFATALLAAALPLVGTPYVEALAATASQHPFQRSAGMSPFVMPRSAPAIGLKRLLDAANIPEGIQCHPLLLPRAVEELPDAVAAPIVTAALKWQRHRYNSQGHRDEAQNALAALERAATCLLDRFTYFLWTKPGKKPLTPHSPRADT